MADADRLDKGRTILRWASWISTELAAEIALRFFTTPRRIPQPEWEREIAARGELKALDASMKARFFGPAQAPAVILIHGWEGRGLQLGLLVEPLLERGFRVIAVDGPAHGESPGRRTNIGEFTHSLHQFIGNEAAAGRRVACVIGHSFGAAVTALALMAGAPAERAVLVAAPSSLIRVAEFFSNSMRLSPKVAEAFRRRLGAWTKLPDDRIELAGNSAPPQVPVLIVHDPADSIVAFANAERYANLWPHARLEALDGVGHFRILKAPSFIAAVMGFLGETGINSPRK